MNNSERPIGVFDSGLGGLTTLAELKRLLPNEEYIYFGDNANAPYGTKSSDEVRKCARRVAEILLSKNIKALVIACNTATGAALDMLKRETGIDVIGIEPSLKLASSMNKGGRTVVLATPLTLIQDNFCKMMELYGSNIDTIPCYGLMELVENEDFDNAKVYLQKCFSQFDIKNIDTVILGCTHYAFLKNYVRSLLPKNVQIIDGNTETVHQLADELDKKNLLNQLESHKVTFLTSGDPAKIVPVMERMYQRALGDYRTLF